MVILSILLFIVILVVLIVVHEWGHFITAKWSGIRVDEFGIGFPPRALTFAQKGETRYTLNWLPIGGFVKIFGEDPEDVPEGHAERPRALSAKPRYIQALVLVAGVAMNVLVAWVLTAAVYMTAGVPAAANSYASGQVEDPKLTILGVLERSPAAEAGLKRGDHIIEVSSQSDILVELTPEQVIRFVEGHENVPVTLTVVRGGEEQAITVTPVDNVISQDPDRAAMGVSLGLIGRLQLPPHVALYEAGEWTVRYLGLITAGTASFIANAFMFEAELTQVAGPVGIVVMTGDYATEGLVALLSFTALLSLNLAVINLLPIPALDGGRLLFVLIEALKGSPIKASVARTVNTVGFVLLMLLMLVVTVSDITKLLG